MPDKICMQPTPPYTYKIPLSTQLGVRPRTTATVRATIGP
jgi:hypothetical protein